MKIPASWIESVTVDPYSVAPALSGVRERRSGTGGFADVDIKVSEKCPEVVSEFPDPARDLLLLNSKFISPARHWRTGIQATVRCEA